MALDAEGFASDWHNIDDEDWGIPGRHSDEHSGFPMI